MPLYEYRCPSCDERTEVLQPMGAGPEDLTCPSCGGSDLARELSTFAAHGAAAREAESGGCGLPQCGGGFCAGRELN
jgi:putative FmdB family regulatory protein